MSNLQQKPNSLLALMGGLFKKPEEKENVSAIAQNAKTLGAVFGESLGTELGKGKTPPKNLNIAPTKLIQTNNGFVGLRKDSKGKPQILGEKKQVGNFIAQTLPRKINTALEGASKAVNAHYDSLKASGEYDLNDLEAARQDELKQLQGKVSEAGKTVIKSTDNADNADKRAALNATKLATGEDSSLKTQLGANQFLQNTVENLRTIGDNTKTGSLKEVAGYLFTPKAISETAKQNYNKQLGDLQNLAKSDNPVIANYAKTQLFLAQKGEQNRQFWQGGIDNVANTAAKLGQPLQNLAQNIEANPEVQARLQNNPLAAQAGDFVGRAAPYIVAETLTGGGMSDALVANAGLKALTGGIKNAAGRKVAQRGIAGALENVVQGQLADPGVQYLENGTYNPAQSLTRIPSDALLGLGFGGAFEGAGRGLRNLTIGKRADDILGKGAIKRAETRSAAYQALTETPQAKINNPEKVAQLQANLEAINSEKAIKTEIGKFEDVAKLEKQEAKIKEELLYETDPNFRSQKDYKVQLDQNLSQIQGQLKAIEQERAIGGLVDENQFNELKRNYQTTQLERQLIETGKTPEEAKAYIQESIRKGESVRRQKEFDLQSQKAEAERLKEESRNQKLSQAQTKNQERYSEKAATQLELLAAKQESGKALTPLDLKKVEIVARRLPENSPIKNQFNELKNRFEAQKVQTTKIKEIDLKIKDYQNQYKQGYLNKDVAVRSINSLKAEKATLLNSAKTPIDPKLNNADTIQPSQTPAARPPEAQPNIPSQTAVLNQPLPETPLNDVNIPAKPKKPQAPRATKEERAAGEALLQNESKLSEYPASDLLEAAGIRLQYSKDPNFYNVNTGKGYVKIAKNAYFGSMPDDVKNLIRSRSKQILNNPRFKDLLDEATINLREAGTDQADLIYKQQAKAAEDSLSKADNQFDELASEADKALNDFDNIKTQEDLDKAVSNAYDDKFEALGEDFYNKLGERIETAQKRLDDSAVNVGIKTETLEPQGLKVSEKVSEEKLLDKNNNSRALLEEKKTKTEIQKTDFEILPRDVSLESEAKKIGAKRISPERTEHQQLEPLESIQKIKSSIQQSINDLSEIKKTFSASKSVKEHFARIEQKIKNGETVSQAEQKWYEGAKSGMAIVAKIEKAQSFLGKEKTGFIKKDLEKLKEMATDDERIKALYIDLVKKDISKGYRFTEEVLNFDKSFKTAVDSRARYEKGLHTSFSADDSRIIFDDKNRISAGMKRQDGKPLTPEQKDEIVNGVLQTQEALGIDLNKLAESERWVYSHLNGKNPFLTKNAAGLYRKDPSNNSVSISLGGIETFEVIEKGQKIKKQVNTTAAHEIGHALDYQTGQQLLDDELVRKLAYNYNDKYSGLLSSSKYWKDSAEIKARAIEQYVAIKEGNTKYYETPAYWSKEIFENEIKPAVEAAINKHFADYKKGAEKAQSQADLEAPANLKPVADALLKPTRYDYARTKPPEMKTWGEYWNYVNNPKNYSTLYEISVKEKINIEGAQKQVDDLSNIQKDYKVAQASQKQAEEALFRRVLRDEKLKTKLEAGEVVTVKADYNGQSGQIPLAMKKGELYIPAEIKGRLEELKANYADVIDDVKGKDGVLNIHLMNEAKSQASTGKTIDEAASEFLKWRIEADALKANRDELKKTLYSDFLKDNFENKGIDLKFKDENGQSVFYITKPAAKTLSYKDGPVTIPEDFGRLAGKTFNSIAEAENAIKAEFGIRKADVLGVNFSKTKGVPVSEKIKIGNLIEERQGKLKAEAQARKDFETRNPENAKQSLDGLDYTLKQIDEGNKVDKALADETVQNLDKLDKQFAFNPFAIPAFGAAAKAIISGQGLADTIELAANAGLIPSGFYKKLNKTIEKLSGIPRFAEVMEGVVFNAPKTIDENLNNIGRKRGEKAGIHGEFLNNFAKLEARIRKFDTDLITKDEKMFKQIQDMINSKGVDEILDSEGKLKDNYKDNILGIYTKTRFEIKKDLIEYAENYKEAQKAKFGKVEKELSALKDKKQLNAIEKQKLKDLNSEMDNLEKSLVYLDDKIAHLKVVSGNSVFDKIQGMGYQAVLWNNPSVAALNVFDFLQVRADGRIMGDKGILSALPIVNEVDQAAGYLFKEALSGNKNKDSILNYFGAKQTGSYNDVIANRKSYKDSKNPFVKVWDFLDSIELNKAIADFNQDAVLVASARNWQKSNPEFKKYPDPVSNYTAFKKAAPDNVQVDFIKHISLDQGLLSGKGASGADFALGGIAKEPVAKQVITFIKPAYRVSANLRRNWQTLVETITPDENGKLTFKPQNLARPEAQQAAASLIANLGGMYLIGGTTSLIGVPGFGAVINAFMKLATPDQKDELEENLNKFSLGANYAQGFGKRLQIQSRSTEKNSILGLVKDRFTQLTEPLAGSYINQVFGVFDKIGKYAQEVEAGRAEWSEFPQGELVKMIGKILPTQMVTKVEQYLNEEFKAIYSDQSKGAFPKKLGEIPTRRDAGLLLSGSNRRAELIKKIDESQSEAKNLIAGFEGSQPIFKRGQEERFNQNITRLKRLTGKTEIELKQDIFKKSRAALKSKNLLGSLDNPGSLGTASFKARIGNLPAQRRNQIINQYQNAYYTERNPEARKRIQAQLKAARSIKEAVNL